MQIHDDSMIQSRSTNQISRSFTDAAAHVEVSFNEASFSEASIMRSHARDEEDVESGKTGFAQLDGDYPQEDEDDYVGVNGKDKGLSVKHKTLFSRRKIRAGCICVALILLLVVLFQVSLSHISSNVSRPECENLLSPSYSSQRVVGTTLCAVHEPETKGNQAIGDILLPLEKKGEPVISFLVVGDFGRDGHCCQRDVAIEMERAAVAVDPDCVVNTGDTFYDNGIMTTKDEQVKTSFLDVYNKDKLKKLMFMSVLGNHDYRGSADAVVQLTQRYTTRFRMEKRNYAYIWSAKGGSFNVQMVFLDTSPFIDSYRIPGAESPTDAILKQPDGITTQWSDEQLESTLTWLEGRLLNFKADFDMRIVIGHHPIYGHSIHKGENRTRLQERVAPLLEKYNVTAYLSGHEHNLQFVKKDETAHLISGAGSSVAPAYAAADTPKDSVQFFYEEHGFIACSAYRDQLRVAYVGVNGKILDHIVLDNRPIQKPKKG